MSNLLRTNMNLRLFLCALLFLANLLSTSARAQEQTLSRGQTVYVSVYSNILTAPRGIPFSLEATLIIRNTDMTNPMTVTVADFYDTEGKLVKKFFEAPLVLRPLETKHIYLPEKDAAGGLGANFIVKWTSEREINAPIVECLMIDTKSGQGISFVSAGKVIKEHGK